MKRLATSIRQFVNSPIRQLTRLALLLTIHCSLFTIPCSAAVPLRWTVETSRAQPAVFEAYHGESLDLEAILQSYGKPVEIDPQADWKIYWQTNGMADAWWSAPVPPPVPGRGVVTATFTPAMDPGAPAVNGFLGSPGNNYRAAFTIRFRHAPGAVPNELPLPAKVIDFNQVTVKNAPWVSPRILDEKMDEILTSATNTAFQAVRQGFRRVEDEYVYAPSGFGDFTYECDESSFPGLLGAIGSAQPDFYDYGGDYGEWFISFEYEGNYISAYATGSILDPRFEFSAYFDYYDYDLGYWDYSYIYFTGKRTVTGYDISEPRDTFAHRSDVRTLQNQIQSLDSALNGETLRERHDGPREYGSGWGYLRRPIDSDFREWRIRATKCSISGLSANTGYSTTANLFDGSGKSYNGYTLLTSPLTMLTGYAKGKVELVRTAGRYGSDSVELADFKARILRISSTDEQAGYYLNFNLKNTNRSQRTFEVTPILAGFDAPETIRIYTTQGTYEEKTVVGRRLNLPAASTASSVYCYYPTSNGGSTYTYTRLTSSFNRIFIDPTPFVADGTVSFRFYVSSSSDGPYNLKNIIRSYTVNFAFSTVLDDYIMPEGRVVTDETANLVYDEATGSTWKLVMTNGVFYSECVSGRDWRTDKNWNKEIQ